MSLKIIWKCDVCGKEEKMRFKVRPKGGSGYGSGSSYPQSPVNWVEWDNLRSHCRGGLAHQISDEPACITVCGKECKRKFVEACRDAEKAADARFKEVFITSIEVVEFTEFYQVISWWIWKR